MWIGDIERGMSEKRITVQTTETTFDFVHTLQKYRRRPHRGGGRLSGLLAEHGLSAPEHAARARVRPERRRRVSTRVRFLTLGGQVQTGQEGFDLAKKKVDQLAAETEERSQFIVEEHGSRFYVYTQAGENAVQTDATIGKRGYLHVSAAGKAILAALPRQRVEDVIDRRGLPAVTEQTITDESALFEELEAIRERGYAYNREESTEGLRAVGVAITDRNDGVIGALSISAPAHRLKDDRFETEFPDLIMGVTNEIELRLEYS